MFSKELRLLESTLNSCQNVAKMIQVYSVKPDSSYQECIKILAEVCYHIDQLTQFFKKCKRKETHYDSNDVRVRLNDVKILIEKLYTQSLKIKMDVPRKQVLQRILVETDKNIDMLHRHIVLQNAMS